MVALKRAEIDAFLAKPAPTYPVVLVYGADGGLVRERGEAILRASVDDAGDPFALVRLDGEEVARDPARLIDEATTIPLFGGRRAVGLRVSSRHNVAPAVELVLSAPLESCRVVIEAGELRRNAPLRALCEKARKAAAIACYADTERDLERLVDDELRTAGLAISREARAALVPLLGGDRRASLSEIAKLATYVQGRKQIEREDVLAVVSDASPVGIDDVIDAAFAGRTAETEAALARARTEGTAPGTILSAAQRHAALLLRASLAMQSGQPAPAAVQAAFPMLHFSRQAMVEAAVRLWTPPRLLAAVGRIAEAVAASRRMSALSATIAERTMIALAASARRKTDAVM
jgi:DNA polymerase-3 subunit delta